MTDDRPGRACPFRPAEIQDPFGQFLLCGVRDMDHSFGEALADQVGYGIDGFPGTGGVQRLPIADTDGRCDGNHQFGAGFLCTGVIDTDRDNGNLREPEFLHGFKGQPGRPSPYGTQPFFMSHASFRHDQKRFALTQDFATFLHGILIATQVGKPIVKTENGDEVYLSQQPPDQPVDEDIAPGHEIQIAPGIASEKTGLDEGSGMIGGEQDSASGGDMRGTGEIDSPVKSLESNAGERSEQIVQHGGPGHNVGPFDEGRYFRLMKDVILLGGPTASGKSALAMDLARRLETVILSADSRQVYRGLDLGTAKPTLEDRQEVDHYLIDICDPKENYTAGRFESDALAWIEALLPLHRPLLVAGGTGLYLKALYAGLDEFPEIPASIRHDLARWYASEGLSGLQEKLRQVDPEYADRVDLRNPRRLLRALEVWEASGIPYSRWRKGIPAVRSFTQMALYLDAPRSWLYPRINQRVLDMLDRGWLDEARRLHPLRGLPALQTLGYPELFDYLEGKRSYDETVTLIQQQSRRYAKRQMTWFRKEPWWIPVPVLPEETLVDRVWDILVNDHGPPERG